MNEKRGSLKMPNVARQVEYQREGGGGERGTIDVINIESKDGLWNHET